MNGCELMKCTDYSNGKCRFIGACKYRNDDEIDTITAERDRLLAENDNLKKAEGLFRVYCDDIKLDLTLTIRERNDLRKERDRYKGERDEFARLMQSGHQYLMSVQEDEITVDECLEAFGWTSDGLAKIKEG